MLNAKPLSFPNRNGKIYHEKQSRQFCLMHTLNNILQTGYYDPFMMDDLCFEINSSRWFNPHRSWIGLGNYDANVLMAALERHKLKMVWFDKRTSIATVNPFFIRAFVFNIPSRSLLPFMNGRHWFPIVQLEQDLWYNLDSKLERPYKVNSVHGYLKDHMRLHRDSEMIIICDEGLDSSRVFYMDIAKHAEMKREEEEKLRVEQEKEQASLGLPPLICDSRIVE